MRTVGGFKPGRTCLICDDEGGHTSAQHYAADRANAIRNVRLVIEKLERETGERPTLDAVMSGVFGVSKKGAA